MARLIFSRLVARLGCGVGEGVTRVEGLADKEGRLTLVVLNAVDSFCVIGQAPRHGGFIVPA